MTKVYTTGQVSKFCHVAPQTVSKWFDSGALKGYRIPGSADRRIPGDVLLKFMHSNRMPFTEDLEADLGVIKIRLLLLSRDTVLQKRFDGIADAHTNQYLAADSLFVVGMQHHKFHRGFNVVVLDHTLGISAQRIRELLFKPHAAKGIILVVRGDDSVPDSHCADEVFERSFDPVLLIQRSYTLLSMN